jgi:hypothetical protein
MVLHERLFADGGDGNKDGHAIEGIFVVDKVVRSSNRAKWREVSAPSSSSKGSNRFKRFKAYLARAKEQAKAIPQDIDLGSQSSGAHVILYPNSLRRHVECQVLRGRDLPSFDEVD